MLRKTTTEDDSTLLCPFFREVLKKSHPTVRERSKVSFLALQRSGIRSYTALLKRLDTLPESERGTGIMVLGIVGKRAVVPRILEMLHTDSSLRFEIREALTEIGGQRALKGLIKILHDKTLESQIRIEACYALAHQWQNVDPSIFFAVVKDDRDNPYLRGQAVEGIAIHGYHSNLRHRSRPHATKVLLDCLDDSTAEVRFWGVFGMICLKVKKSLPKLRELARNDHQMASLGWSVAEEAKDAIYCLTKGRWPEIDASVRKDRRASGQATS